MCLCVCISDSVCMPGSWGEATRVPQKGDRAGYLTLFLSGQVFFLYSSINLSMLTIEKDFTIYESLLEIKSYNSDVYVSDAGIWGALTRSGS